MATAQQLLEDLGEDSGQDTLQDILIGGIKPVEVNVQPGNPIMAQRPSVINVDDPQINNETELPMTQEMKDDLGVVDPEPILPGEEGAIEEFKPSKDNIVEVIKKEVIKEKEMVTIELPKVNWLKINLDYFDGNSLLSSWKKDTAGKLPLSVQRSKSQFELMLKLGYKIVTTSVTPRGNYLFMFFELDPSFPSEIFIDKNELNYKK